MGDHDHSYKQLFSHPQLVEDLLRGFVPEPWIEQLDFRTLEKVSGSYVTDDLRDREDDVIWRVRWRAAAEWLYVYLLLEFQSTVEWFMAVRVMVYEGLLYQDLIKQKLLTGNGLLPPVLPIVLYNGDDRWNAPERLAELIDTIPGGLERYRPDIRYLVLDEGRYTDEELKGLRNVVAAVFRLESSRTPMDVINVLTALHAWLQAPEQAELRRTLARWLSRVLLRRRVPGVVIPEVNDLREVQTMLEQRVIDWSRDWREQGLAQGREQGLAQGREQGLAQGREQGLAQGREQGLAEGALTAQRQMLTRLLEKKFGPLSEDYQHRLAMADTATLFEWSERLLSAVSLDEVFGNG